MGKTGLRTLMVVVAVIAADLAAGRALYRYGQETHFNGLGFLGEFMPGVLMLQGATAFLTRARGRKRAFWAGFVALGSLVLFSRAWYHHDPPHLHWADRPATGQGSVVKDFGSPFGRIWEAIEDRFRERIAFKCADRLASHFGAEHWEKAFHDIHAVFMAVFFFLITLALASLGGLASLAVDAARSRWSFAGRSARV